MNSLAKSARPAEGLPFANAFQMFADRVDRSPTSAAIRFKEGGAWRTLTWRELSERAREVAIGLREWAQIERGERVAILAGNSLGWVVVDIALAQSGVVTVPIEPHERGAELADLLEKCNCAVVVVGAAIEYRRVRAQIDAGRVQGVRAVLMLDGSPSGTSHGVLAADLATIRRTGQQAEASSSLRLDACIADLGSDDLFTIIHTPKTSGQASKSVALSQRNIVYETWALRNVIAVDRSDEQLLVLPLCHAFGRHLLWAAFASGAITSVMDPGVSLVDNLRDIAPTFLGAAPVVYEAIRRRILREVEDGGRMRTKTFAWCLEIGRQVSGYRQRGELVPGMLAIKQAAADRLVFSEIRRSFGGRLRFLVSGAAPARREVLEFFHAAGLLILEGYGLTETSGAVSVNRPDRFRFGTVGPALPGCEVRVADDGEVLVRGNNVMAGYLDGRGIVVPATDERGWFHTGDLGAVQHGFLRIIGRKSETITLASGRLVHPEPIEQALGEHPDVAHALVCGAGRDRLSAVLTLDRAAATAYARRHRLGDLPLAAIASHPQMRRRIDAWIERVNATLPAEDRIAAFAILPRDLGASTGELTPTLRPRRRVVYDNWADTIDAMYATRRTDAPDIDPAADRAS